MSQTTSELFPAAPVLIKRLGPECFDGLPQLPGVYRFYDKAGTLLYAGKAKNLRTRLFQYKQAKAGRVSRKTSKLIGKAASFDYEVTETEWDALLLENRLIRSERPPFNHANKQPETYYYIYFKPAETGLEFRLAMHIHEGTDPEFWHGCFKGHVMVRRAMGGLLQLLWMTEYNTGCPMYLPVQLTRRITPLRYHLAWAGRSPILQNGGIAMLKNWMEGASCELVTWLAEQPEYSPDRGKSLFKKRFWEHQTETLKTFYHSKLVPHREMRKGCGLISQEQFDDKMVLYSQSLFPSPLR